MFTIEESIVVDRPVDEVFAFVSDVANDPKYREDILDARWTAPNGPGLGKTFEHHLNFMGRKWFTGKVTHYQPNRRIEVQYISGSIRPTYSMTFEALGAGTRIVHRSTVQTFGLLRLMEPIMPRMGKARLARDYLNLKRLLEV